MLHVLLDTLALAFLIKVLGDEEPGGWAAYYLAVGAALAAFFTGFLFVPQIGPLGYVIAGVFAAVGLSCMLHLAVGVEIRRALAIGAIFIVVHAVTGLGLSAMIGGRRGVIPFGPSRVTREVTPMEPIEIPAEEYRKLEPDVQRFFTPEKER